MLIRPEMAKSGDIQSLAKLKTVIEKFRIRRKTYLSTLIIPCFSLNFETFFILRFAE